MNWLRWFLRRSEEPARSCRRCSASLVTCSRCDGSWQLSACEFCMLGATCPTHKSSWI